MSTGWPAQINSQRLSPDFSQYVAVLVAGPTATQDTPFLPQQWPKPPLVIIAPTHRGMARLCGTEWPG